MSYHVFPAEFLFWIKNPMHEKHKQELLPQITELLDTTKNHAKTATLGMVNSAYFDADTNYEKYSNLITEAVYPAVNMMFEEIPNLNGINNPVVSKIWYNYYDSSTTTWQNVHMHPNAIYSGIYFLELHEPNTTVFFSQLSAINKTGDSTKKTEFIEEGDILLFPSTLLHYVLPSTKQKITITFDINF
jgi:hypothetical protein